MKITYIKMTYSIEPIHVKVYWFLSFAENMGTHLSNKYSQTRFDTAKNLQQMQ